MVDNIIVATRKYMGDGVLVYFGYPQAHEAGCALQPLYPR